MRPIQYGVESLKSRFQARKVLTIEEVLSALGTTVRMTAIRKLAALGYRSSYSHGGTYYTLDELARFDNNGLWDFGGIRFSEHGGLIHTVEHFIRESERGCFASELRASLKVRVHAPLLRLHRLGRILRKQIVGEYLFLDPDRWEAQLSERQTSIESSHQGPQQGFAPALDAQSVESTLEMFLSALNEKQRRLWAGFESMRRGVGGDVMVARVTGMNVKTVARGRKELLRHDITPERIRQEGAGRPSVKKNRADGGT